MLGNLTCHPLDSGWCLESLAGVERHAFHQSNQPASTLKINTEFTPQTAPFVAFSNPFPAISAFPPLGSETRVSVSTACAAYHLNRRPQSLRAWACHDDGPLRPLRIHGRLAWPVAELRRVLGVAI